MPFDPAGLRGRAVKLSDALSISFKNAQMFSRQEGTISFWLKPIGWKRGRRNLLVMVLNDSDAPVRCELTLDFVEFGFNSAMVKCLDYGSGGLAYPDSFQEVTPKSREAENGKPIPLEIGGPSYRMLRFCE